MPFYLINESKEIVGTATEPPGEIAGYKWAESDLDLPLEQLYWTEQSIAPKPPPPSPAHRWSAADKAWVAPPQEQSTTTQPQNNWGMLAKSMETSPLLAKGYAAAEIFSKAGMQANLYVTVMLTIINSTHNLERLVGAIAKLRSAMTQISTVGDFTAEELADFRGKLKDAGFELTSEMTAALS